MAEFRRGEDFGVLGFPARHRSDQSLSRTRHLHLLGKIDAAVGGRGPDSHLLLNEVLRGLHWKGAPNAFSLVTSSIFKRITSYEAWRKRKKLAVPKNAQAVERFQTTKEAEIGRRRQTRRADSIQRSTSAIRWAIVFDTPAFRAFTRAARSAAIESTLATQSYIFTRSSACPFTPKR